MVGDIGKSGNIGVLEVFLGFGILGFLFIVGFVKKVIVIVK